jgi:hypothetical protein
MEGKAGLSINDVANKQAKAILIARKLFYKTSPRLEIDKALT